MLQSRHWWSAVDSSYAGRPTSYRFFWISSATALTSEAGSTISPATPLRCVLRGHRSCQSHDLPPCTVLSCDRTRYNTVLYQSDKFLFWFYHFTVVLVFTNSCINPLIYACMYRQFQHGVRRLAARLTGRQREVSATTTGQESRNVATRPWASFRAGNDKNI